eukprot:7426288-Karenia_brevis.AAC.1
MAVIVIMAIIITILIISSWSAAVAKRDDARGFVAWCDELQRSHLGVQVVRIFERIHRIWRHLDIIITIIMTMKIILVMVALAGPGWPWRAWALAQRSSSGA